MRIVFGLFSSSLFFFLRGWLLGAYLFCFRGEKRVCVLGCDGGCNGYFLVFQKVVCVWSVVKRLVFDGDGRRLCFCFFQLAGVDVIQALS